MKILLILPDEISSKLLRPLRIFNGGGILPPLGLLYIASSLKKYGYDVKILDMRLENFDKIITKILKFNPDFIGISLTIFTLKQGVRIAKICKEILPNCKIIIGGSLVTLYPKELLYHYKCFDIGFIGEAESTLPKFLDRNTTCGIAIRKNKKIIVNGACQIIKDLDSLPFPDRKLIANEKYFYTASKRYPVTSAISSRGCPFSCKFCGKTPVILHTRFRSPNNVVREMEECYNMGFKEVVFYDDIFTLNKKRVLKMCNLLKKLKLDLVWSIRSRIDTINKELLKKMRKAGCIRIFYGIESGSNYILKLMDKKTNVKMAERIVRLTKRVGMDVVASFIIGYPDEDIETVKATIKFAIKLKPDFVIFNPFIFLPNSPIYLEFLKNGMDDFYLNFVKNLKFNIPNLQIGNFQYDTELKQLVSQAYKKFYLNHKVMINVFKKTNRKHFLKLLYAGGLFTLYNTIFNGKL